MNTNHEDTKATKKKRKRRRLPETTAREMLERRGFMVGKVETKAGKFISRDLFGFADLLAVHDALPAPTLAVQVCAGGTAKGGGDVSKRVLKMTTEAADQVRNCLRAGWRVEIWGVRQTINSDGSLLDAVSFWLAEDRQTIHHCEGSLTLLHLSEI